MAPWILAMVVRDRPWWISSKKRWNSFTGICHFILWRWLNSRTGTLMPRQWIKPISSLRRMHGHHVNVPVRIQHVRDNLYLSGMPCTWESEPNFEEWGSWHANTRNIPCYFHILHYLYDSAKYENNIGYFWIMTCNEKQSSYVTQIAIHFVNLSWKFNEVPLRVRSYTVIGRFVFMQNSALLMVCAIPSCDNMLIWC